MKKRPRVTSITSPSKDGNVPTTAVRDGPSSPKKAIVIEDDHTSDLEPSPPKRKKQLLRKETVPTARKINIAKPATEAIINKAPPRVVVKTEPVTPEASLYDEIEGALSESSASDTPLARVCRLLFPCHSMLNLRWFDQEELALGPEEPLDDVDDVTIEDHRKGDGVLMAQIGDTVHILWRLCLMDGRVIRNETSAKVRSLTISSSYRLLAHTMISFMETALTLGEGYISQGTFWSSDSRTCI